MKSRKRLRWIFSSWLGAVKNSSYIETARMRLRRFREADAQHLYALDNDPAVMRYINGGTHTPYDVICKEILPVFLRRDEAFELGGFWAAGLEIDELRYRASRASVVGPFQICFAHAL
ncbi:MAG: RimJ/RimL family protein N-acetyltransferase [Planctomycetota bacterium]|jgi:RimJ/RimL family protein N-acetyltransferase